MFFQIGFGSVGEFHFDTPAIDGMDAFKCFSATGTGFGHLLIFFESSGGFAIRPKIISGFVIRKLLILNRLVFSALQMPIFTAGGLQIRPN